MSEIDAFLSTWNSARRQFGEGTPTPGSDFDNSSKLQQLSTDVQAAAPGSNWTGSAAETYDASNQKHGAKLGVLSDLDRRLAAEIDKSALTVNNGRQDLDAVRKWVEDAAGSVPPNQAGQQMMTAIASKGLGDLTSIVERSNGDMNQIAANLRELTGGYKKADEHDAAEQGNGLIQTVSNIKEAGPFDHLGEDIPAPPQPAPSSDASPFIGNPDFGHWEPVSTSPTGPWPPLEYGYRSFGDDPVKKGATTGLYVPDQPWAHDKDSPAVQFKEGYRFRIAGEMPTNVTQVVNVNGEQQLQRWVCNVYEYQRNTAVVPGGDLAGAPPIQNIDQDWKPISPQEIMSLSNENPAVKYYLPNGCGVNLALIDGVFQGAGQSETPVARRPR